MKTKKHCDQCWRSMFISENDLKTKPLKCVELIKIFKDREYKVNSFNSDIYVEKENK